MFARSSTGGWVNIDFSEVSQRFKERTIPYLPVQSTVGDLR